MEFRGERADSECESIGWAANVRGKVAEDQRPSWDGTRGTQGAVSKESGHSDHGDQSDQSTCESKPASEVLHIHIHGREPLSERTGSVSLGSKAIQRADGVLGTTSGGGDSSQVEERTTHNEGAVSQSSAGGGPVIHGEEEEEEEKKEEEEERPLSTDIRDNSPANAAEVGDVGERNNGGNISNNSRSNSTLVAKVNEEDNTRYQKLPSNLIELTERLSESLGMAVATVFHEVFERSGDLGTTTSTASPVDELSGLLEAALKESLVLVLGNERGVFLKNFRNSFRSNYQTMRSVRRAFAKTGGKLTPSKQLFSNSQRGSRSKPWRVSPSRSYRERARKNLDETRSVDKRKKHLHVHVENAGVAKNNVAERRHSGYNVETISEEEIASFTPTRYAEPVQQVDFLCSSGDSCLNESLQSAFFTNSTREQEGGHSDTTGSCSKSCLNESLKSSFFTSSNPEQERQENSTRSGSLNTVNESAGSLFSDPTPGAYRDEDSKHLDTTEDSGDVHMFSATSSTESDEWVTLDSDDVMALAHGQNESPKKIAVTFDAWASKKDHHNYSRRVVEYEGNPSAIRGGVVGNSLQDTQSAGSSHRLGRGVTGDSMRHAKPLKGVDGGSMEETKSVESVDNSGGNENQNSPHPETFPRISSSSSGRVHAVNSLERPGNLPAESRGSQVMSLGASAEIGESSGATEPRMNLQHNFRGGADLFGRLHMPEDNILVQRRRGHIWGDVTQLNGPSPEDDALVEAPPFFNYEVRPGRQALLERYVEAQETQNHLKSLEIAQCMKLLLVQKDHLQLQSESNVLMKENVDVSRSRMDFKECELEDRKLSEAHRELSQMCADELVAGLCVMLFALIYSAWKFSYSRLSRVVTICRLTPREPRQTGWLGTNWMTNSVDAITYQMQALICEVTKAGRMLAGLIFIALVTSSLVRRSVTNSQTMPATIIIVVLAVICGFAGKVSIDSLGGDGFLWLLHWELLCLLHVFATSCTPWLYRYLYGPAARSYQTRSSSWMKLCSICARFSFHMFLVFVLPLMAGLLPFASIDELNGAFWEFWETDTIIGPY